MNGKLHRQTAVNFTIERREPITYKVVGAINKRLLITFFGLKPTTKMTLKTLKSIVRSLLNIQNILN